LDSCLKSLCPEDPIGNEGNNETSTMMMALGPLAVNCPELEREIITAMVLNYKSLGLPSRQLVGVVRKIAAFKGLDVTTDEYLKPMLSFVLNEFLKQGLPLEDFPHRLLYCDTTEEFVSRYESLVLPLYLWRKPEKETVDELKIILKVDRAHLLVERNFVQILAYYLPHMNHSKRNVEGAKLNTTERKAEDLSNLVVKKLGQDIYYSCLQNKFPEILSEIYKQIYDPGGHNVMTRDYSLFLRLL
jgi:hypothetical protein